MDTKMVYAMRMRRLIITRIYGSIVFKVHDHVVTTTTTSPTPNCTRQVAHNYKKKSHGEPMKLASRYLIPATAVLAISIYGLLYYNEMDRRFLAGVKRTAAHDNITMVISNHVINEQNTQLRRLEGGRRNDIFVKLLNTTMYLYGACFPIAESNILHTEVTVYGMILRVLKRKTYTCCLQYVQNGKVMFKETAVKIRRNLCSSASVQPIILICDLENINMRVNPVGVSVTLENSTCSRQPLDYVKPYQPARAAGALALSTKLIFGKVSSEVIIEWVEAYRALGVDKIVSYASADLNDAARRVLEYYDATGFVDLYDYDMVAPDNTARYWTEKRNQVYCDVTTVMIDAIYKLVGYEYYGFVDLDEIILPSRNRTLKQFVADMRVQEPEAAAFMFKSKYLYTSWGQTGGSDLIMQQYVQTSHDEPAIDRPKLIRIRNRTDNLFVDTHNIKPLGDFKTSVRVPPTEAFAWHYRTCRKVHAAANMPHDRCMRLERTVNRSVADWSERIAANVRRVRNDIFARDPQENTYLADFLKIADWD